MVCYEEIRKHLENIAEITARMTTRIEKNATLGIIEGSVDDAVQGFLCKQIISMTAAVVLRERLRVIGLMDREHTIGHRYLLDQLAQSFEVMQSLGRMQDIALDMLDEVNSDDAVMRLLLKTRDELDEAIGAICRIESDIQKSHYGML